MFSKMSGVSRIFPAAVTMHTISFSALLMEFRTPVSWRQSHPSIFAILRIIIMFSHLVGVFPFLCLCRHYLARKAFTTMHCYVISHRVNILYLSWKFVTDVLKHSVVQIIVRVQKYSRTESSSTITNNENMANWFPLAKSLPVFTCVKQNHCTIQ